MSSACAGNHRSTAPSRTALLGFVAATLLAYGPAVVGLPFYTKGEPREAIVVQRMLQDRDFVLPHRTATEIPTKPPLFHWLGAGVSAASGGVTETSVRLPSVVASLFVLLLTLYRGTALFGASAAWMAVAMLATSQQWIASSVTARVDMTLAGAIAAAMFFFERAHDSGNRWPDAFWLSCALAVLAKGPVGIVLPMACVVAFLFLQGDLGYLKTIRPLRAALCLVIPACWYALAWHRAGDVFAHNVVSENFYRMTDADAGENLGHRHSALFYVPALLAGFAPWSLFLVGTLLSAWRESALRDRSRSYLLVWLGVTVLFFSLAASKRPVYLLSCYAPAALLMGEWLDRCIAREPASTTRTRNSVVWLVNVVLLVAGSACAAVILQCVGVPVIDRLRPFVSAGDAANLVAVARGIQRHHTALLLWATCSLALLGVCRSSVARGRWRNGFTAFVLVIAASTGVLGRTVFADLATSQSLKVFIQTAVAEIPQGDPIYFYAGGDGRGDPAFYKGFEYAAGFYAQRPLAILETAMLPAAATVWLITTDAALRAAHDDSGTSIRFRELARFTYDDNPRRAPLVFVRARRTRDRRVPETPGLVPHRR